jgi:hypothetical protein
MLRVLRRSCALTALLVCLGAACEAKHMAVIVDKANAQGGITAAELTKLLKFDSRKWPDGRNVTLVLMDPSMPEMQSVIEKLYHMQPDEVKALLVSHRSEVIIVSSEEQLLKLIESTPGAVGLVDVYSINGRINVLKVDGKLPLEQGYLLK